MIDSIIGGGLIGAGASLINGFFQRKAAEKAAKIQHDAAVAAGQHLEDTVKTANPQIIGAAQRAGDRVTDAAWNGITGVNDAVTGANKLLDPYAGAGADASNLLRARLAPGGEFDKTFAPSDLTMDPGYQFRLDQGQKALERSAAAHGGATSGGALKDLTTFSQGTASQEFQNAFNRFRQDRQDRFGNLNTVANRGIQASDTQGSNLIGGAKFGADTSVDASKFASNADINAVNATTGNEINAASEAGKYITGAGDATASGIIGGSNAMSAGVGGAVNGLTSALTLSKLLKNPGLNYFKPKTFSPDWGN